jgi:serpin B
MIENFDYNVFVGEVNHKTFISMDVKGTKAAAVTEVETEWKSGPEWVALDHPFVYMIVDSTGLPIFIGTFEG